jgi:hypothetical protein
MTSKDARLQLRHMTQSAKSQVDCSSPLWLNVTFSSIQQE